MGGGIGLESSGGGSSDGGGGEAELNGRNAARLLKRHCAGSTRQRARAIQTIALQWERERGHIHSYILRGENTNQIGTLCVDSTDPCAKKTDHTGRTYKKPRETKHDKRGAVPRPVPGVAKPKPRR